MRYLALAEVFELHRRMLQATGGGPGIPATLQGAPATHRGARCRPSTSQPAAVSRSATRPREVLGDVPTVALDSAGPHIRTRSVEVSRGGHCTASDSRRSIKRGLVLGSPARRSAPSPLVERRLRLGLLRVQRRRSVEHPPRHVPHAVLHHPQPHDPRRQPDGADHVLLLDGDAPDLLA